MMRQAICFTAAELHTMICKQRVIHLVEISFISFSFQIFEFRDRVIVIGPIKDITITDVGTND
jgi:hypothetical protein